MKLVYSILTIIVYLQFILINHCNSQKNKFVDDDQQIYNQNYIKPKQNSIKSNSSNKVSVISLFVCVCRYHQVF